MSKLAVLGCNMLGYNVLGGVATNAIADELIDVIKCNRVYVPFLNLLNKIDAFTIVPNPHAHDGGGLERHARADATMSCNDTSLQRCSATMLHAPYTRSTLDVASCMLHVACRTVHFQVATVRRAII